MKGTIIINEEEHQVDTDAALRITDPDADRATVAAEIGHWGAIWAESLQGKGEAEAQLDHWRASALSGLLRGDEKVSEWKAKAVVDAQPDYLALRQSIALWERNATLARCQFEAFKAKAGILEGLSYREHGEERVASMQGREVAEPAPKTAAGDARVAKMAAAVGATKAKK